MSIQSTESMESYEDILHFNKSCECAIGCLATMELERQQVDEEGGWRREGGRGLRYSCIGHCN